MKSQTLTSLLSTKHQLEFKLIPRILSLFMIIILLVEMGDLSAQTPAAVFEGKVGIHETAPDEDLVVGTGFNEDLPGTRITIGNSSGFSGINIGQIPQNRSFLLWDPNNQLLKLGTKENDVLYDPFLVLRAGNLGIGTLSPIEKLHIYGGNLVMDRGSSTSLLTRTLDIEGAGSALHNNFAQINFKNYDSNSSPNSYVGARISAHNATGNSDGELRFTLRRNGNFTEAMRLDENQAWVFSPLQITKDLIVDQSIKADSIDSNGELEITDSDLLLDRGTATSGLTRKLTLTGARNAANVFGQIDFKNIDDDDGNVEYVGARIEAVNDVFSSENTGGLNFYINDGSSLDLIMRLGDDLDPQPNIFTYNGCRIYDQLVMHESILPASNDTFNLGHPNFSWHCVYSTNPLNCLSDAREKEEILPITHGLDEILKLRPVSFKWRNRTYEDPHLGLIAQEVKAVIPEVIVDRSIDKNPATGEIEVEEFDRLHMRPTELIPVLIKAIQEQQDLINTQAQEITAMKKLMNKILNQRGPVK